ncbi:MAG: prepilin-type N-terminal cleavage/methylation domain-containing protein [Verrucomicrobia bacterium]|nr:prepilin-type N-terminal cleavage/methylation domain-containing protein [Verrucomicrobiota bacterium]
MIRRFPPAQCAFTLVETAVAIAVLGIGVASTIGALTQMNSIAATSRNYTGAYTILMNQIDLFQSAAPFNPQKNQIPKDSTNTPATYDMTIGTHAIGYQNPSTGTVTAAWPIYQDPNTGVLVTGAVTTTVSQTTTPNTYQAVFSITYTDRGGTHTWSMTTIRTSDS